MKSLGFKKILISLTLGFFIFGIFPNFVFADSNPGDITFTNPLAYDTVDGILAALLVHLQGVIVVISMVFIVVGALLYMTSAGNEKNMTLGKGAIWAAVVGLAIGIAAEENLIDSAPSIATIALNVLNFLLSVTGVFGIIMLVAAGIAYLTAAGNEGQIETAKKMTKWAIIGIAVALGALVIVKQVASFF
ncbi:MAG: hypothetical protein UR65_C0077G0007 [Candidatus Moranbacteria bacterium GW2011_GWE2_35_164]|nr:MAG: hypothetical protein UR65_C0077G0007 [Candidatus Moranbacteria bacterium GW2011_GWE2_35_164]